MRATPFSAASLLLPNAWDIIIPTIRRACLSLFSLGLVGGVLLVPACDKHSGHVPVYAVGGQVSYLGRPVPNAFIALHPIDKSNTDVPHPISYADPDGRFSLGTYGAQDGAPAGEYAVTVVWWAAPHLKDAQEGDDTTALNRLPPRYADAKSSGLRVHITEGSNELTLRLTR
jgi:hypothetical protein